MKFILIISIFSSVLKANDFSDNLKNELYLKIKNDHIPLNYKNAGEILFTKLDNLNGSICSIYNKTECLVTDKTPDAKLMNIEHSWPQSLGANGIAKSDLHHLFVADSSTNSIRSDLPFCEVEVVKWTNEYSKRGFSKFNEHCFEPPTEVKGDIARALMYFSIRYQISIDENQEYFIRKWNKEDLVDNAEASRNNEIKKFQGNSNPFIEDSNLADKILNF